MKKCIKCEIEKSLNSFSKRSDFGYRGECKDCVSKWARTYRKENKVKLQAAKNNYNITIKEAKELYDKKECDICEKTIKIEKHKHIDHCHKTNKIRGTLCSNCNRALGYFKDDIKILQKAIKYLKSSRLHPMDL